MPLLIHQRQAVGKYEDGIKLKQALEDLKKSNDKQYYVLLRLPDFYEDLGLLVNRRCLSLQLANDMFGTGLKYHYNFYKAAIENMRQNHKDDTIYEFFEDLAKKVKE